MEGQLTAKTLKIISLDNMNVYGNLTLLHHYDFYQISSK